MLFPSKFITPRPVDIWLPESYSDNKKYAVLYMHDAQMLFDANTTWNKQEWMMDEVASRLMEQDSVKDFIIVAIHNISQIRWLDLFPEKAINYFPEQILDSLKSIGNSNFKKSDLKGDEYLKFLVTELKPFIDKNYSVNTDKENTFVMGSSMGGLMSMYAVAEYPDIFKGAACISTHWVGAMPKKNNPFPDAIFGYVADNVPSAENHKLYFDYGNQTLDKFYPQYAARVDRIFLNNGYTDENFKNLFFEGTDHSEKSWQQRVHIPLTFLLSK
ncbi:MAG: prolyl oligopeptidase family serine peptidase [Polaribacter sp.]|nr:prolyl oligopeptidase family serine peptidase [Polaribacter sp.]